MKKEKTEFVLDFNRHFIEDVIKELNKKITEEIRHKDFICGEIKVIISGLNSNELRVKNELHVKNDLELEEIIKRHPV